MRTRQRLAVVGLLLPLLCCTAAAAQRPAKPGPRPSVKRWALLTAAEAATAELDAWSTRRNIEAGGIEHDPLMRPFVHSDAMYAEEAAASAGMAWFARRMQRSRRWRRLWWLPQALSLAGHVAGFSWSVTHYRRRQR